MAAVPDEDGKHIPYIVLGFNESTNTKDRDECTRALFEELLKRRLYKRVLEADDPNARYHARVMNNVDEKTNEAFEDWKQNVMSQPQSTTEDDDASGVKRLAMELRELPPERIWIPSNRVLARGRQTGRVSAKLSQDEMVRKLQGEHGFTCEKAKKQDGSDSEGKISEYEARRDGEDLRMNEYKIYLAKIDVPDRS